MGMIRYLTGCHGELVASVAHEHGVGLLVQPGNRYHRQVHKYPFWAGDNGAFTTAEGGFSAERFRAMLQQPELHAAKATCLFVAAPDRITVEADGTVRGDAAGTLDQFREWALEIRAAGFPVALVAQNGLEDLLWRMVREDLWALVDVLFLGGGPDPALVTPENRDGEWKLSPGARRCVFAAKMRGKLVHMGRVNSYKRLQHGQTILAGAAVNVDGERMPGGCIDTADGTFLKFGMKQNVPRMLEWFGKLTPDPVPYQYKCVEIRVSFETGEQYLARREAERAAAAGAPPPARVSLAQVNELFDQVTPRQAEAAARFAGMTPIQLRDAAGAASPAALPAAAE